MKTLKVVQKWKSLSPKLFKRNHWVAFGGKPHTGLFNSINTVNFCFWGILSNSSILKTLKVPQNRKSLLPKLFKRNHWWLSEACLPQVYPTVSILWISDFESDSPSRPRSPLVNNVLGSCPFDSHPLAELCRGERIDRVGNYKNIIKWCPNEPTTCIMQWYNSATYFSLWKQ